MKILGILISALLLAGCATPRAITDTASLVSRMSGDMDRSVTAYVASLKSVRAADALRLQKLQREAALKKVPMQDELQIMTIAEESRTLNALNTLAVAPDLDPLRLGAPLPITPSPVSFDGTPLKNVASITRDIAKPRDAAEELTVLVKFAQTVNGDLQNATAANNKPKP